MADSWSKCKMTSVFHDTGLTAAVVWTGSEIRADECPVDATLVQRKLVREQRIV